MNEMWIIRNKEGNVRMVYGWFETEKECEEECVRLRSLTPFEYYAPHPIKKANSDQDDVKILELEIIKSALEGDIIRQRQQLTDNYDIRFEVWLKNTEKLLKKVGLKLFNLKGSNGGNVVQKVTMVHVDGEEKRCIKNTIAYYAYLKQGYVEKKYMIDDQND